MCIEKTNSFPKSQKAECNHFYSRNTLYKRRREKVEKGMGRQYIFFKCDQNSSGVAILFRKNINFEICDKKSGSDGRLLILKNKIDEKRFVLCNVYVPTQDHKGDQINFLIDVKNSLSTYQKENILLGGDFNQHLNPKLDKIDSMSNKNDNIEYRKEMLSLLDSMNLSDRFRYTWHARGKSSHLDYWFISENLINDLYLLTRFSLVCIQTIAQ